MKSAQKEFRLSPCEVKVARLAKLGRPQKEMADTLNKSLHTVRRQFLMLRAKIGADSAAEATFILSHYKV